MKKILSIVLVLMLLAALAVVPTAAANTQLMKVYSAYYTSGMLYAFVDGTGGVDPSTLTVKPQTDAAGINNDSPKPITDTDTTIEYILLIDASASMQSYLGSVFEFVSSLTDSEQLSTTVSVASFGEDFDMVREDLHNAEDINNVVQNEIYYIEQYTNICGSVVSAIEYIQNKNRTGSEVINLVVITDGQPDPKDQSSGAIANIAKDAEPVITTCPEIILHTICFGGNWEQNTFDVLSKGTGIHKNINSSTLSYDARNTGVEMADLIDNLYTFSLPLKWEFERSRADVKLRVQKTDDPKSTLELFMIKDVADLEHIADESDVGGPIIEIESQTPDDISSAIIPDNPSTAEGETPTAALEATADQPNGIFTSGLFKWILIAVGAVIIAAAAVVIIIVILKKRKKSPLPPASDPNVAAPSSVPAAPAPVAPQAKKKADGPSITMKLRMIAGASPSASKPVELVDEIIIGSAPDCDIILDDPAVSAHNARVFVENSIVYIENISSTQNTYLEGMKLFSRNRLRSQSEITIGNTTFTLLF